MESTFSEFLPARMASCCIEVNRRRGGGGAAGTHTALRRQWLPAVCMCAAGHHRGPAVILPPVHTLRGMTACLPHTCARARTRTHTRCTAVQYSRTAAQRPPATGCPLSMRCLKILRGRWVNMGSSTWYLYTVRMCCGTKAVHRRYTQGERVDAGAASGWATGAAGQGLAQQLQLQHQ